jgi:hypothetical protein
MFGLDWLSTVCSLAGCDIPLELVEGEDMLDVLEGRLSEPSDPIVLPGNESVPIQDIVTGLWFNMADGSWSNMTENCTV